MEDKEKIVTIFKVFEKLDDRDKDRVIWTAETLYNAGYPKEEEAIVQK